jgi:hypothetical protein
MTHRAEQVLDALAALDVAHSVGPKGVKVYKHRRESLAEDQDELPAHSFDVGELEIVEETEDELYWALSVSATAAVVAPTEGDARRAAIAQAREIHRAIMATPGAGMPWTVKLGLAFVITVRPLGWDEPEFSSEGEMTTVALKTNWRVEFKTDVDDPGDDL